MYSLFKSETITGAVHALWIMRDVPNQPDKLELINTLYNANPFISYCHDDIYNRCTIEAHYTKICSSEDLNILIGYAAMELV